MNRQFGSHTSQKLSKKRLLRSLCLTGLSLSMALTAVSPVQASIIDRFREIFQPSRELKSATGTRRGGGSRDICINPLADTVEAREARVDSINAVHHGSLAAFAPWATVSDPEFGEQEILIEGKTLDAYPKLSLYVPFAKADNRAHLEFSISNIETSEYVAGPFDLALPETAGLVTINMADAQLTQAQSETPQFAGLQADTLYEWTVTLRCDTADSSSSLQSVSGLISLASEPTLAASESTDYATYLDHDLWYDLVAQLINNREQHPDLWADLLTYVGLGDETVDAEVVSQLEPTVPTVPVTE